jgi:hypothetical protein
MILLVAHSVTDLRVAADQVGHNVIVALRTGDFDLGNFQTGAVKEKCLIHLRHLADGKTQNNEPSDGIIRNDFARQRVVRRDNRLRKVGRGLNRHWRKHGLLLRATGGKNSRDQKHQRHKRLHGDS